MKARLLALLAVLLAGVLLIAWSDLIGGAERAASNLAPGAGEDRSGATETAPASQALIEDGTLVLTDVRQGPPTPAREAALPSFDGQLVIPPGTPADESLQLSVYDFSSGEWRPVVVAPDGTFRVGENLGLPLHFALQARYLRLAGVEPEREGDLWVLRPRLGARVVGHVVAPWSSEQPVRSNVYVGQLPSTTAEWEALGGLRFERRPTYLAWVENQVDEFTFDALPVGVPLVVEALAYFARPARERLTLTPGETRRLVFTPVRAVTLSGTLVSAVNTDLSEYRLRVHYLEESGVWSTIWSGILQEQSGAFRIDGLPSGRLCLSAQDDLSPSRSEIVLDAGPGDVEGIRLEVDRPHHITGFVVWTDGELVEDSVRLLAQRDGLGGCQTETDTGAFLLDGAVAGATYRVHAELSGGFDGPARSETLTVTAPAAGVRFVLPRPGILEGVVTSTAGAPVRSGYVYTALGPQGRFGSDGRFHIRVPPGTQRLAAYSEGHAPSAVLSVVVGPGESIGGLELSLGARGARIRGEIVDEHGTPLAVGLRVSVQREPGNGMLSEPFSTRSDARGAFLITDLPAGAVSISAAQSRSSDDNPVDVHFGEGSRLVVRAHLWRTGPELLWLAAGEEHFVRLTARRMAN